MSDPVFTFDRFILGELLGRNDDRVDDRFLQLWRAIYPRDAGEERTSPAMATALVMRAYLSVVSPRPAGNVHAGQKVSVTNLPDLDESISTELFCIDKEERRGRKFVTFGATATGSGGRPLYSAELRLIWAA